MRQYLGLCLLWTLAACGARVAGAEPAKTHEVQLNGHRFTLPVGFDIELAVGPPLIDRPISADFDEQGRLYVTDSSGSSEPVEVQLKKKPHRIVRLEDSKGTGHFDRRTIFADKMMFPEGALWFRGSLYVAAPPSIWKLTDTDGDGVADQRSEWFQGKTMTRCANELHGPYLGPDGWIYWCKGAAYGPEQTYPRPGRKPFVTRASHIFRCRPDGSGVEPVMTGGMDNPVAVVFTPGGERIFTTTFLVHPGGGQRDGLIHAIYGGVYGKVLDVLDSHPWTAPTVMPNLTHFGAAAPAGLLRYEGTGFGPEYQDNLFAALFNMRKVTRHVLEPSGATFRSRDEDFLVSNNLDFHPTGVVEDADGSLLVIDTGGWYKLCCPTSQLGKPDVLGAIYRVRRQGMRRLDDPRGLRLEWSKLSPPQLVHLLDDPRPAVRQRAIQVLGEKGAEGAEAIGELFGITGRPRIRADKASAEGRRNAVWAATRIDHPRARGCVRAAVLLDGDETVRQAALHSVCVWRDQGALPAVLPLLKGSSAHNRRAAAEALGRIGDKSAVPALLEAVGQPADRVLEHSLTFALIDIADREGTAVGLKSNDPLKRRAALIALDQMEGGKLEVGPVAAELTSTNEPLKEAAWWIAGRHPEWGATLAGFLRDQLAANNRTSTEGEVLAGRLARFGRTVAVQELLAERLGDAKASPEARRIVLRAMAQSGLKEVPPTWLAALTGLLGSDDPELLREALATVRALPIAKQRPPNLVAALVRVGNQESATVAIRLSALAAVPGGLAEVPQGLFAFLGTQLGLEQPVATRSVAAEVLARAKLTSEQLIALCESLKTVGPMELDRLLEAFVPSTDEAVGRSLVAALKEAQSRTNLRPALLRPRLAKYGPAVQKQAEELFAALEASTSQQKAALEKLLPSLTDGDVRRGQAVFNSTKASCAACHAIGYLGGNVGPDLTRIGSIRSERDMLEAIVFPSASFVQSFEPILVTTKDGRTFNGLIRKDTPDEVVLATGVNQEVRLARADIEDIQASKVSVMPAGLDQLLTRRELADLMAFLKACK